MSLSGENDRSMILSAGLGIAVKNAATSLQRIASCVTPVTNDEHVVEHLKSAYFR